MKVTIKSKEPNAIEKRNTAITTFILVAAIPLLLMLLLGFGLGQSSEVNKKNLELQLKEKEEELEKMRLQFEASKKSFYELGAVFYNADTLRLEFNKDKVKKLEDALALAETEIDIHKWKNDLAKAIDDFKHKVDDVEKPLTFKNDTLDNILSFGKDWLNNFAETKNMELFTKLLVKKQDTGNDINQDLEAQLTECNHQKAILEIQLATAGIAQDKASTAGGTAVADLSEMEENVAAVKDKINAELSDIRDNILPVLKGARRLQNNEEEIQQLKEKLQNRVTAIQNHLGELN